MSAKRRTMTAELECELQLVERELEDMAERTRSLARELGAKYAEFRCEAVKSDETVAINDAEIISLSTMTDECIQAIYTLELRRRELLRKICK